MSYSGKTLDELNTERATASGKAVAARRAGRTGEVRKYAEVVRGIDDELRRRRNHGFIARQG